MSYDKIIAEVTHDNLQSVLTKYSWTEEQYIRECIKQDPAVYISDRLLDIFDVLNISNLDRDDIVTYILSKSS